MPEVVRAAELPVKRPLNLTWKELDKLLHACWRQSTDLANWSARQLLRNDIVRTPDMNHLPAMPKFPDTPVKGRGKRKAVKGLYGLASVTFDFVNGFWKGAAAQAGCIVRDVERHYRRWRKDVLWTGSRQPVCYDYPYPFPVHNACWEATYRDGRPVVTVSLPGGKVQLDLRCGPEFGRQLALFRDIVEGRAKKTQLVIRRQRASNSCHRATVEDRQPGGGERVQYRVMVKFVVRTEISEKPKGRTLTLTTDPSALWVAELDGRRAFVLNADHVKRCLDWLAIHERRLQRWAEDTKAERRADPRRLRQFEESRERACLKHSRRMDSWLKESAAHLARFCVRQGVTEVAYSDRDRGFAPRFPWRKLHDCLLNRLQADGINMYTSEETCPSTAEVEVNGDGDGVIDLQLGDKQEDLEWARLSELREKAARRAARNLQRNGSHPAVSGQ